jgi:hypothetical protein
MNKDSKVNIFVRLGIGLFALLISAITLIAILNTYIINDDIMTSSNWKLVDDGVLYLQSVDNQINCYQKDSDKPSAVYMIGNTNVEMLSLYTPIKTWNGFLKVSSYDLSYRRNTYQLYSHPEIWGDKVYLVICK